MPRYIYNRNIGHPGCVTVMGSPQGTREAFQIGTEMNTISRFVWGLGAAANAVYNAQGALVKFQSDRTTNERRAKLLTKIWRYCKANGIPINSKTFDYQLGGRILGHEFTEDFEKIIKLIKIPENETF